MIKVEIPQIEVSQENPSLIDKSFIHLLPQSLIFGQHNLRHMDFAARHNYINKLLVEIYVEHELEKNIRRLNRYYSFHENHFTYKNNIETSIYWLRKTADELISLIYYLNFLKLNNNSEPEKILVDSIGKLLYEGGEIKIALNKHVDFLTNLNDVSNSFKHSFINRETNHLIGDEEPTVVSQQMKQNDQRSKIAFHSYFLREIISSYQDFFSNSNSIIQEIIIEIRANS